MSERYSVISMINVGIDWYGVVDKGLIVFMTILCILFVGWAIYKIVEYSKIIYDNFNEHKIQQAEELAYIKKQVNDTLAKAKHNS